MPDDTEEEDIMVDAGPRHKDHKGHERFIQNEAEGCLLPKQISSKTTVAELDRHVKQNS